MASELRVDRIIPVNGVPTGGGGGIIQMKQNVYSTSDSTTSTSMEDVTGFSVSITPTSSSSKILVMLSARVNSSSGSNVNTRSSVSVYRGATQLINQFVGSYFGGTGGTDLNTYHSVNTSYLDSPATISSITYQVKFSSDNSGCTTSITGGDNPNRSTLTVMEISG
tara:strand:+ start:292 stop:789 length:498 start_codon:yes stop_codon:yes gene_type:complete